MGIFCACTARDGKYTVMKSGRYIGVMSGTSLDGVDVVLAAIDEHTVAQQARYCHPMPLALKQAILDVCQGQAVTLSTLGGAGLAETDRTRCQRYHGDRLSWSNGVARASR